MKRCLKKENRERRRDKVKSNIKKLIERNTKHGLSKDIPRLYRIWKGIKARCYIKSASGYKDYGGRGIYLCEEWFDYKIFYQWSLRNGYNKDLTLERINVNSNYSPNNCKWISKAEQANNKRNNVKTEINNEELTLTQISNKYNISYNVVLNRYHKGVRGGDLVSPKHEPIKVEYLGETISLSELSKKYNVKYATIWYRYHKGYTGNELIYGKK